MSKNAIRRNKIKDVNYSDLNSVLNKVGLYCKDVLGDGNCIAISDQLFGTSKEHETVRQNVCEYMENNSEEFIPFVDTGASFEKYLENMRKSGTFGGNMELVACSGFYNAIIKVYQVDSPVFVISLNEKSKKNNSKIVHLGYHDYEHYSSVRNINGPHYGPPEVVENQTVIEPQNRDNSEYLLLKNKKLDSKIKSILSATGLTNRNIVLELLNKHNENMDSVLEEIYSNDEYFNMDANFSSENNDISHMPMPETSTDKENLETQSSKPKRDKISSSEKKRLAKLRQKQDSKAKKQLKSGHTGADSKDTTGEKAPVLKHLSI
ncbi:hypothetical protein BB560_002709 [Smittium megazygosporum]|uniref:OTU domain-containing protein n=1 Tax=Smittium megazygosporum TaxID=133381 RepID=A0A2T9ZE17_9FUNG|nr:hypothetical protein BB560_002709 [Smittium megazygosporum]